MLTIKDSVDPLSWEQIVCVCDCRNEITLAYMEVYARRRFSCGCTQRLRFNAADATGVTVQNGNGNYREGRELTILYRDPQTAEWVYLCKCCNETFSLPRGGMRGAQGELLRIAGMPCPNWRGRFIDVEHIERFMQEYNPVTNELVPNYEPGTISVWPRELAYGIGTRDNTALLLAPYFQPDRIVRDRLGKITGFFGWPAHRIVNPEALKDWTDLHRLVQKRHEAWRATQAEEERKMKTDREPIPVDMDRFEDLAAYQPTAEALEYDRRRVEEEERERLKERREVRKRELEDVPDRAV